MSINQFDEDLDALAEPQDPTQPAVPSVRPVTPVFNQAMAALEQRDRDDAQAVTKATVDAAPIAPERAGQVQRIAKRLGLPEELVERNFDQFSARDSQRSTPIDKMLRDTPKLAEWLAENRFNAAVAADDLPAMTALEKTLRFADNAWRTGFAGLLRFNAGVWGSVEMMGETLSGKPVGSLGLGDVDVAQRDVLTGKPEAPADLGIVDFAKDVARLSAANATRVRGEGRGRATDSNVEQWVYDGIESMTSTAPAILASFVAGPEALLGIIGTQTAGTSYHEARQEGLGPSRALLYGTVQGVIEVGTEYIPAHRLLKDLALKSTLVKTIVHQVMPELVGENVATVLQDLNDWATLPSNENKPFSAYLAERPSQAAATTVATLVMLGATSATAHTTAKLITSLGATVAGSKVATRNPDAIADVIGRVVKNGPLETVYAPLDTWTQYWQSQGEDPRSIAADLTGNPQAYDQALQTGEDLAIPLANYVATLGATDHNAYFANELRLAPDEMNERESADYRERAEAISAGAATAANPTPIKDGVIAQLVKAGVPLETASTYADLYEAAFGNLAKRAGLDPAQLFSKYGLRISRAMEGVTTAEGAAIEPVPLSERRATPLDIAAAVQQSLGNLSDSATITQGATGEKGTGRPAGTAAAAAGTTPTGAQPGGQGLAPGGPGDARGGAGLSDGTAQPVATAPDGPVDGGSTAAGARDGGPVTVPEAYADTFAGLLSGARGLGYVGTEGDLAERFLERVDEARTIARDLSQFESDEGDTHVDLLRAIAAAGGIGLNEEGAGGMRGEIGHWLEALTKERKTKVVIKKGKRAGQSVKLSPKFTQARSGGLPGIPGIIVRTGGLNLDYMREAINEDKRWSGKFDNLSDFMRAVEDAILIEVGVMQAPGATQYSINSILDGLLNVRPDTPWWQVNVAPDDEDTSFNVEEFGQPLQVRPPAKMALRMGRELREVTSFEEAGRVVDEMRDVLENEGAGGASNFPRIDVVDTETGTVVAHVSYNGRVWQGPHGTTPQVEIARTDDRGYGKAPAIDVLATGEKQPRLPGDAGAVRDTEVQQPKLGEVADTFELTPPEETDFTQTTLFQRAFHGSPFAFEQFSLHAIGSGEGNQAYGWGLYFASKREVAEHYRRALSSTGQKDVSVTFNGVDIFAMGGLMDVAGGPEFLKSLNAQPEDSDRLRQGFYELYDAMLGGVGTGGKLAPGPHAMEYAKAGLEQRRAYLLRGVERLGGGGRLSRAEVEAMGLRGDSTFNLRASQSYQLDRVDAALEVLAKYGDKLKWEKPGKPGRTYEVDVPENDVLVDWDKPASKQPAAVQAAFRALGVQWGGPEHIPTIAEGQALLASRPVQAQVKANPTGEFALTYMAAKRHADMGDEDIWREWFQEHGHRLTHDVPMATGERLYRQLGNKLRYEGADESRYNWRDEARLASEALNAQGVLGIRYLDGTSRPNNVVDARLQDLVEKHGGNVEAAVDEMGQGVYLPEAEKARWRASLIKSYRAPAHNFVIWDEKQITITAFDQPLYHGSPHDVDRFSVQNIGTGQGAQSYGWGLYFAENPAVAESYHEQLAGAAPLLELRLGTLRANQRNGFDVHRLADVNDVENIRAAIAEDLLIDEGALHARAGSAQQMALELLDARAKDYVTNWPEGVVAAEQLRKELAKPGAVVATFEPSKGGIYQVDIDKRHLEQMLDFDASIDAQPDGVKELVRQGLKDAGYLRPGDNGPRVLKSALRAWMIENGRGVGMMLPGGAPNGNAAYQIIVDGVVAQQTREIRGVRKAIEEKDPNLKFNIRSADRVSNEDFARWKELGDEIQRIEQEAPRAASMALKAVGVPGLKYFDQGSRDEGRGTRNVVVWDDSIITLTHKNGTPVTKAEEKRYHDNLGQDLDGEGRRGAIQLRRTPAGDLLGVNIKLFEQADLSTFLHETGHFYLEVFGDVAEAIDTVPADARTPEQAKLAADYKVLLDWLGVADRAGIGIEQHEKLARGFEAYLMEGNAPSESLRPAFARFRSWLLGIYRSLRALNVHLTDDVRKVFDRLLVSDQAISDAQAQGRIEAMFLTAADAGMTAPEFALYRTTVEDASRQARETLDIRLLVEVQREREKEWVRRRAEVTTEVTSQVDTLPEQQALAAMQRGTLPDGTARIEGMAPDPLKLDRQAIVDRYGKDRLKALPRPAIYAREGGIDPDVVAQMFGFASGDALLEAMDTVVPRKQAIEAEVNRRMLAEFGSVLLDGTLHEKAQAAVANQGREQVIKAELRALANLRRVVAPFQQQAAKGAVTEERRERAYERRWFEAEKKLALAIQKGEMQATIDQLRAEVSNYRRKARGGGAYIRAALPNDDVVRETARKRIAATTVRQLKPARFWTASRRAAQGAVEAAARQDFDGAIALKQQELANLALYREAVEARDDAETRVREARKLNTPAMRSKLGLAGESYLDQVDAILDRFDFATVSQKNANRRASLIKWVEALEGQGLPVDLPEELLNEALRTPYQDLAYETLVGVTDGLQQIAHLATLKNKLLRAQDEKEFDAAVTAVEASIRDSKAKRSRADMRDRSAWAEQKRLVGGMFAAHRKIASLAREMDGFEDGGAVWEAIIRPLNEAGDREAAMNAAITATLGALIEQAYPGRARNGLHTKLLVPAVGQSLTRMQRIMVALNWGNEGNRDRVRTSEKWTDQQVQAVLNTLDDRDAVFVQGLFDAINDYWPEIEAKQKRVYGVAPAKVVAVPFRINGAELNGGYFPLKYDERLSATAAAHMDLEAGLAAKQAAYVNATTRRGHTKARATRVSLPIRLDFGVITEHLVQVIHDLSHHEALIDVSRMLQDRRIQTAIYETHGDVVYRQFKTALKDIAYGDAPAVTEFEKGLNHLRSGASIAGLGWNLVTAALQPVGLTQSMVRIGPTWVLRGLSRWTRDAVTMENTVRWITERSEMMRLRGLTQQREISEIRNRVGIETGKLAGWVDTAIGTATLNTVSRQAVADSYFYLIQQLQRVADVPTWLGQYEKSMAAGETEARSIALADQAVLDAQAGGQVKDLAAVQRGGPALKVWTTFYSFFNTTYNLTAEATRRTKFSDPFQVGRLAVDYALLYIIPATLGYAIRHAMAGDLPDDDKTLAKELARENAAYLMGTMLGLRELAGIAQGYQGYEGPAGARAFAALGRFAKQAEQGALDAAFWRSLNDSAGILFHYPSVQVRRTIEGLVALAEGRTSNPAVVVGGPGPKERVQ